MDKNLHFDLSHFSLIQISGTDANQFLQNQLITDLDELNEYGWLLSAWCISNGRILCNFILYEQDDAYFLVLPSMFKQKIMQRLGMFVLRSKVDIIDCLENYALIGLYGVKSLDLLKQINKNVNNKGNHLQQSENCTVIHFQDDTPRMMLVIPIENLGNFMNQILMACEESDRSAWSLLDIESGIPWITEATSEQFLPQMLNLDLTGGLSHKKGCYPGQEIIARVHYRGEIKKRLFIGTGNSNITPGPGDQLEELETGKLVGDVIDAEPCQDGQFKLLAICEIKENGGYKARLRGSEETTVTLQAIP